MATPMRETKVPNRASLLIFSLKKKNETGSMTIGVRAIRVEAMPT